MTRFSPLIPAPPRPAPRAAHFGWAALALAAFTVYGGLLPFHCTPLPLADAVAAFRGATVWDALDLEARGDWVVSFVQYALVGFTLVAAAGCDRRRTFGLAAAPVAAAGCAALAVGVEFLQVYFPPRTVSVNDIVIESAGGTAGVLAWLAVGRWFTGWLRRLDGMTTVAGLARWIIPAYVLALIVAYLMPFDFVFGRDEMAAKVAENKVWPLPFSTGRGPGMTAQAALHFGALVPLGIASALASRSRPSAGRFGLGAVILVPVVVEFGKLFVYSRTFDSTNIVVGVAGVVLGWRLVARTGPAGAARWAAAARSGPLGVALGIAWLAAVLFANWQPFDFTNDPARFVNDSPDLPQIGLRHMALAPFVDYYEGSKYHALDVFALKGLSFVPLGVLLAIGPQSIYRRGSGWIVLGVAAVVAFGVEAGRYFLPPPRGAPSVTDVLLQCGGAWLGFRIVQYARAVLWAEAVLYGWQRPRQQPLHFITLERAAAEPDRPGASAPAKSAGAAPVEPNILPLPRLRPTSLKRPRQ
jgi:VanZ family protein